MQFTRAFTTVLSTLALGLAATAQTADVSPTTGTWTGTSFSPSSLVQLHNNGPWITGVGNGAAGADTSEIQAGFNTFGYGMQVTAVNRLADDFPVPAAQSWTLSEVVWLSYQTGSSTTPTFTDGRLQFWSGGAPNAGGTVLAGDTTTNRFIAATWTNVYKVTATTLLSTTRPIMNVRLNASFAPALATGTYWVDCTLGGTLASGPWGPPTVPAGATDNALQNQNGVWVAVVDGVALLPQDFPFTIEGSGGGGCPPPTIYCTAKTTSSGCVPAIGFTGTPTPAGAFTATCANVEVGQLGVLFYGTTGPAATPFQGGFLCVNPPVIRLPFAPSGGTSACTGSYSQPLTSIIAPAGTAYNVQFWFRDPGAASGTGLSNAMAFTTCP